MAKRSFTVSARGPLAERTAFAVTGRAGYVYTRYLAARRSGPFAAHRAGTASGGMARESDMSLSFITGFSSPGRPEILMAEINGKSPDRVVPNIPVVCVLTQ